MLGLRAEIPARRGLGCRGVRAPGSPGGDRRCWPLGCGLEARQARWRAGLGAGRGGAAPTPEAMWMRLPVACRRPGARGRYPAAGRELGAQDALPVWGALPSPAAVSEAGRGVPPSPRRSSLSGARGVGRRLWVSLPDFLGKVVLWRRVGYPACGGRWNVLSAPRWEWNLVLGRVLLRLSPRFVGCGHQRCLPVCVRPLWGRIRIRDSSPSAFPQRLGDSGKGCKMDGIFELLSNRLIFE